MCDYVQMIYSQLNCFYITHFDYLYFLLVFLFIVVFLREVFYYQF